MKEAASLLATGYIQEYYDKVYAQGDNTFKTTYPNIGVYAKYKFPNATEGGFTYAVADSQLTVTDTKGNTVTGTILDDGTIDWSNITTGGNNGSEEGGPTIVGDVKPQRWDSVNYNPGTLSTASLDLPEGAEIEKTKLASLDLPAGATLDSDVTANQATDWKVLDYDEETGDVLIIPTDGTFAGLKLSGMDGYNNGITALDEVSSIYKNTTYAKGARSITVEDLNKIEDTNIENEEIATQSTLLPGMVSGAPQSCHYYFPNRFGMSFGGDTLVDYGEGNVEDRCYYIYEDLLGYEYSFQEELPISSYNYFWTASKIINIRVPGAYESFKGLGFGMRTFSTYGVDDLGGPSNDYSLCHLYIPGEGETRGNRI